LTGSQFFEVCPVVVGGQKSVRLRQAAESM
jgi:hypothetical protein